MRYKKVFEKDYILEALTDIVFEQLKGYAKDEAQLRIVLENSSLLKKVSKRIAKKLDTE